MCGESEKLFVTKVVEFILRIPEQLSLHFSEFSTNLYGFYKFTEFESRFETFFYN